MRTTGEVLNARSTATMKKRKKQGNHDPRAGAGKKVQHAGNPGGRTESAPARIKKSHRRKANQGGDATYPSQLKERRKVGAPT